jgi:cell division septum initiation protein DivIVA
MTYLELTGLILTGAGTMASILGIFFAVYTKHNNRTLREESRLTREAVQEESRLTREAVQEESRLTRETMVEESRLTREMIAQLGERLDATLNKMNDTLQEIARLVVAEGEKTRQAIKAS